eukprot:2538225-Amphidinium_carterae.1
MRSARDSRHERRGKRCIIFASLSDTVNGAQCPVQSAVLFCRTSTNNKAHRNTHEERIRAAWLGRIQVPHFHLCGVVVVRHERGPDEKLSSGSSSSSESSSDSSSDEAEDLDPVGLE